MQPVPHFSTAAHRSGEEPVALQVPHAGPKFQRLERIAFASLTDGESVFYLDNIAIEPIKE